MAILAHLQTINQFLILKSIICCGNLLYILTLGFCFIIDGWFVYGCVAGKCVRFAWLWVRARYRWPMGYMNSWLNEVNCFWLCWRLLAFIYIQFSIFHLKHWLWLIVKGWGSDGGGAGKEYTFLCFWALDMRKLFHRALLYSNAIPEMSCIKASKRFLMSHHRFQAIF